MQQEGGRRRTPFPRPPSACFRGWNPPQTLARVLASGSLLPFPSRVGTRVLLGLRGLDFSRSINGLVLLSGRRGRARLCPRIHPGSLMIAECMLDCGWREDKLLSKCAWAGGPRLGRLGIEGGGSARGCEGETPMRRPGRPGRGCVKGVQILRNPWANNCQTSGIPAPPLPCTQEEGENLQLSSDCSSLPLDPFGRVQGRPPAPGK